MKITARDFYKCLSAAPMEKVQILFDYTKGTNIKVKGIEYYPDRTILFPVTDVLEYDSRTFEVQFSWNNKYVSYIDSNKQCKGLHQHYYRILFENTELLYKVEIMHSAHGTYLSRVYGYIPHRWKDALNKIQNGIIIH